jgi:hypothetical protein
VRDEFAQEREVKKEIMMEYFLWMSRNDMTSDSLLTRQAKQIQTLPCALFPLLWFATWMPPRALFFPFFGSRNPCATLFAPSGMFFSLGRTFPLAW